MRPGICAFWPTFETGHAQHSPMRSTRNLSGRIATHTPMCMQSMECRMRPCHTARNLVSDERDITVHVQGLKRDTTNTPITTRWPLTLPNLLPCASNLSDFCISLSEPITAARSTAVPCSWSLTVCTALHLQHTPSRSACWPPRSEGWRFTCSMLPLDLLAGLHVARADWQVCIDVQTSAARRIGRAR